MADREHRPPARTSYASRIDEEGQLHLPEPLRDLTGLSPGMDVTLSEGRDGFVVILPAKLATAEDIASWPTEPPPTLREGSEKRVEHLLGHIVGQSDTGDGHLDRLVFSLGTWLDELTYTLGVDWQGPTSRFDAEAYVRRMKWFLTIIAMHDVWSHEGDRPPLKGQGELIGSYAWYRTAKLSGWDSKTAAELVREDRGEEVVGYLDSMAAGAYA